MKTIDVVLIILLLLFLTNGLKHTLLHLHGEGSCCGGSKEKVKSKRYPGKPIKTLKLSIDGMHCSNCKNRIVASLQKIDGVSCDVNLSKKEVNIKLYHPIDESQIHSTIAKLGYTIVQ